MTWARPPESIMAEHAITFKTGGGDVLVTAAAGKTLLEIAQTANLSIDAPCGGNGSCGKCRLLLLEGNVDSESVRSLSSADETVGWRLACKSRVVGDTVFELPDNAEKWRSGLKLETVIVDDSAWLQLCGQLKKAGLWEIDSPDPKTSNDTGSDPVVAVDLGTTSVSVLLLDKDDGNVLAQASAGNAQIRYGADVINRIIQQTRPGGIERFQRAIVDETINPLISKICEAAGVAAATINELTIAGNTTMNHLLLGLPAESIRVEPFVPLFLAIEAQQADSIGLAVSPAAVIHIAPNVGSYVGGDITAGILASGLWQSEEMTLFIDLGTNGELVLGNNEFMLTCACSAGPAFEGGDIECGMRATDGAIEAVELILESLEPTLRVIGDSKPNGICGSGLIDLVSELFRCGAINGKGRFTIEGPRFIRDEYDVGSYLVAGVDDTADGHAITLSEVDTDNFIRAKAAIFSAIMIMLETTGLGIEDISKLQIAGGIGGGIDIDKAVSIGLFPDIERSCFSYLGNASLLGARAMALSASVRDKVETIATGMTYLELSTESGYMDAFMAACFLPHTDRKLFPSLTD